jgi:hypothetical protein
MNASDDKAAKSALDCAADPDASLKIMFVDMIQQSRIEAGQCPALRPVFHKVHGSARGELRVRPDVDARLREGIFAGEVWPCWLRFSSDTSPNQAGFRTTLGIGLKLFDVPGEKLIGDHDSTTFDLIFQNHDVFFVDTAQQMCAFIKAIVVDRNADDYLARHPEIQAILDAMAKPEPSLLSALYWTILPFGFGETHAKFKLVPQLALPPLTAPPGDPDFLGADLVHRISASGAAFTLCVQLRNAPESMPLDQASLRWDEERSPFLPLADLVIPVQDIAGSAQAKFAEDMAYNIWRVTEAHRPAGSIANARRLTYQASANLRRKTNAVPDAEPKEPFHD